MKVSLTVLVAGPMEGKKIPITIPQFVIGRAPQCNLQPGNPTISEMHCVLDILEERVLVRDLGSVNGTFVNDRKISGAVQLNHGDRLKVGPLIFGLAIEVVAKPTPPPEAPAKPAPPPAPPENRPRVVPETGVMSAAETAEMNLQASDTACENKPETPDAGQKPPKAETKAASVAAKELLKKYLRRKRNLEQE